VWWILPVAVAVAVLLPYNFYRATRHEHRAKQANATVHGGR
jgi:hypothetical protein